MEPTAALDIQTLKSLIKDSVREVMREAWFKFFDLLIPYVDHQEQAEIEASFSPADHSEDDFVEITHWFNNEDNHVPR